MNTKQTNHRMDDAIINAIIKRMDKIYGSLSFEARKILARMTDDEVYSYWEFNRGHLFCDEVEGYYIADN